MPLPAVTANKALVDWYVCTSGTACQDYNQSNAVWSLVCQGNYECVPQMGADTTYVVALPTSLRGTPNSNLTWAAINGL
jgi:hypothetical protein